MDSRERTLPALDHEEPDRVPVDLRYIEALSAAYRDVGRYR